MQKVFYSSPIKKETLNNSQTAILDQSMVLCENATKSNHYLLPAAMQKAIDLFTSSSPNPNASGIYEKQKEKLKVLHRMKSVLPESVFQKQEEKCQEQLQAAYLYRLNNQASGQPKVLIVLNEHCADDGYPHTIEYTPYLQQLLYHQPVQSNTEGKQVTNGLLIPFVKFPAIQGKINMADQDFRLAGYTPSNIFMHCAIFDLGNMYVVQLVFTDTQHVYSMPAGRNPRTDSIPKKQTQSRDDIPYMFTDEDRIRSQINKLLKTAWHWGKEHCLHQNRLLVVQLIEQLCQIEHLTAKEEKVLVTACLDMTPAQASRYIAIEKNGSEKMKNLLIYSPLDISIVAPLVRRFSKEEQNELSDRLEGCEKSRQAYKAVVDQFRKEKEQEASQETAIQLENVKEEYDDTPDSEEEIPEKQGEDVQEEDSMSRAYKELDKVIPYASVPPEKRAVWRDLQYGIATKSKWTKAGMNEWRFTAINLLTMLQPKDGSVTDLVQRIASLLDITERYARQYYNIFRYGNPDLLRLVQNNDITIPKAEKIALLPGNQQNAWYQGYKES